MSESYQQMKHSFRAAVQPTPHLDLPAFWLIFRGSQLLVQDDGPGVALLRFPASKEPALPLQRTHYLGVLETEGKPVACLAAEVGADFQPANGSAFYTLRQLFGRLPEPLLGLAGRAVQIIDWDRTHVFCGRCGAPMEHLGHERAKSCPACGLTSYPRISPAMIVSVEREGRDGREILLARNHRHPSGFYSVLAGFVEPGESLEECVRREVCEEVGLEIENIRYFGSQPWPFPNSLMIAFTADYASGTVRLERQELADAGWYRADALPPIPPPVSIARQLINAFVARNQAPA